MRLNTLGWSLCLAGILAAGCTIQEAADDADGGAGAAGAAGTGGATAGTGGGTAGSAGADNNPCGAVPLGGECVDDSTIRTCLQPDGLDGMDEARIVESTCPPGRTCKVGANGAACEIVGECTPGDVQCSYDGRFVRNCEGAGEDTHWVDVACDENAGEKCVPGSPSTPAGCRYVPAASGGGTGATLAGRMQYQYRPIRDDNLGWGDIRTTDVVDMYITIYDNGEFIGAGLSGWDSATEQFTGDGSFVALLTREMTGPDTQVWAWPIVFNYTTGMPAMAIAKLKNTDVIDNAREANEYWAWGIDIDPTTTDFGIWEIKENEYSGALHIFSWIDYGLLRTSQGISDKQMSVAVYWDPNTGTPSCGACFCGPPCGGAQLQYGDSASETDYYDSWIALGGPPSDGSTEWARAVISHEFGHYVMHNYSVSPGEGGQHFVNAASRPGLAYSEAWATAFGCSNIGNSMYVDEQSGSFFWVDISKYTYSGGGLELPNPNGPIDQYINENVGAGMIWKMYADGAQDPDGRGLGDAGIFGALTYDKLVNGTYNRGYEKVDLIDYFDSAICSSSASEADINAVIQTTGFPYDPATRPCQ